MFSFTNFFKSSPKKDFSVQFKKASNGDDDKVDSTKSVGSEQSQTTDKIGNQPKVNFIEIDPKRKMLEQAKAEPDKYRLCRTFESVRYVKDISKNTPNDSNNNN